MSKPISERLKALLTRIAEGKDDLDGEVTPAIQEAMRKSLESHPGQLGRALLVAVEVVSKNDRKN